MPDVIYNWKRYWVPRDGVVSHDFEGFPVEPGSEAAAWWKTDSVGFDKRLGRRPRDLVAWVLAV